MPKLGSISDSIELNEYKTDIKNTNAADFYRGASQTNSHCAAGKTGEYLNSP